MIHKTDLYLFDAAPLGKLRSTITTATQNRNQEVRKTGIDENESTMNAKLQQILSDLDAVQARVGSCEVASDSLLRLSGPNSKTKHMLAWIATELGQRIRPSEFVSLSLLSGVSCPGAKLCKSMAVPGVDGKRTIQDSPNCKFRCFSASDEAMYTETYQQREHNRTQVLACGKDPYAVAALLLASIAPKVKLIRIHIGGDFLSFDYLLGWILFAAMRPQTRVYAYTKSLHFLAKLDCTASDLPSNMRIVLSEGGLFDNLIPDLKARGFNSATVVFTKQAADDLGLEIDHKDNLAAYGNKDFALLIHAAQPAGSEAAAAVSTLRKAGDNGYNEKRERA